MDAIAYIVRCIIMLFVTWTGVRLIGKKSIANMTSYDFAGIMLLTTVTAEPLVYKIPSKASVGAAVIVIIIILLGALSLKTRFYNMDSRPTIVVSNGNIQEKELKQSNMNIPLLLSELRLKGYQNIADVKYAIIEPNGKLSVVPAPQARPLQPNDMAIQPTPISLSFPLIIDGEISDENLTFLQKDKEWLMERLMPFSISDAKDVLLAQMDSQGKLYVINKNKEEQKPNIF
ncbi:DUF421 domain-containing protein [Lentibacillus cibarius]|uniref:DUF421 domain-containing protein n=1 Tax=Lentibacillus cibarius TaxID=2583219 RepID=A0A549YF65_9BACI|nr:DUF421 domain-containing protein [Lentibacillus cibarius]TMN21605.1 DUF421 domain-containing protein [Lentibacillus cibarius]TRM10505.1 DUF421 domain-containing protein [Lentibacillus cibarius]